MPIASTASRRSLGAIVGVLGALLLALLAEGAADAGGRRGQRRGRRDDKPRHDARRKPSRARGRDGHAGVQAEKKRNKKKKKPPACPNGQRRCGAGCVDTANDAKHCGGCGATCAPDQRCQGGTCTCNGAACDGCCDGAACRTGGGDALCGANGAVCQECTGGRSCQSGSCECPQGQHFCAGACVNRLTNALHCGACGRECADNEICRDGFCGVTCGAAGFCLAGSAEPTCCTGTCLNTRFNARHCGACGNDCMTQRANICDQGVCKCGFSGAPCPADETCCNQIEPLGACRNTNTDKDHCGACGSPCDSQIADRCVGGACKCGGSTPCTGDQRCCNGACRDINTTSFCGSCQSACNLAKTDRCGGGVCSNTSTDDNNCGGCGIRCDVQAGQQCCSGLCRDIRTDPDHCGGCGLVCRATPLQAPTTNFTCRLQACSFSCKGLNYDMNDDLTDGCEQFDPFPNHTRETAHDLGSLDCFDEQTGTFSGAIYSDTRVHDNPPPPGRALWYKVHAIGSVGCLNDPRVTLTMTGGTSGRYQVTMITDKAEESRTVVNGVAHLQMGSASYSGNTTVFFKVEKHLLTASPELAFFDAEFNL